MYLEHGEDNKIYILGIISMGTHFSRRDDSMHIPLL